jgi:hypothetical protein
VGLPYINIEDKTARDSWNTFISMLPDSIQQDFISDVSNKLESTEGRPLPFVKIHETAINRPYYEFPEDLFGTGWGTPDTIGVGANLKGNFSTLFENMMAELSHAFEEDIPLEDLKKQKKDQQAIENILTHKDIVKNYEDLYYHKGTSEWAHQEEGEDVWFDYLQNYVYKDGNYPDLSVVNKPKEKINWFGRYLAGQKYHEDITKYKSLPKYKKQESKSDNKYSWKPKLNEESKEAIYKSKSYIGNLLKKYKKDLKEGKVDKWTLDRMMDIVGLSAIGGFGPVAASTIGSMVSRDTRKNKFVGAQLEDLHNKHLKVGVKGMLGGLMGVIIQEGFMPYLDEYQIKGIDKLLSNIYGSNNIATNENVNVLPPIDVEAPQVKYEPETLLDSLRVLRSMHQYGALKK